MAYAFGLEFPKENCGDVHFLIWASNVAVYGSFAHRPSYVAPIQFFSTVIMLYMFLGQQSMRIIMVLFNCIFGKYK